MGTLIGTIGGPVGMIVGLLTGTLAGTALDQNFVHFSKDITSKVALALKPGMVAIIAEMYEQGPMLVDGAMEPLGTTIFRSNIDYAFEDSPDQRIKEIEELNVMETPRIPPSVAEESPDHEKH
jgi:hypothetical protein